MAAAARNHLPTVRALEVTHQLFAGQQVNPNVIQIQHVVGLGLEPSFSDLSNQGNQLGLYYEAWQICIVGQQASST